MGWNHLPLGWPGLLASMSKTPSSIIHDELGDRQAVFGQGVGNYDPLMYGCMYGIFQTTKKTKADRKISIYREYLYTV